MAVKTKDELIQAVVTRIGEDSSDEAIALIEDVTDTLNDFETKANGGGEDWKTKYDELDKSWREKYISRFTDGSTTVDNDKDDSEDNDENSGDVEGDEPMTYEDLFEEEKEEK